MAGCPGLLLLQAAWWGSCPRRVESAGDQAVQATAGADLGTDQTKSQRLCPNLPALAVTRGHLGGSSSSLRLGRPEGTGPIGGTDTGTDGHRAAAVKFTSPWVHSETAGSVSFS